MGREKRFCHQILWKILNFEKKCTLYFYYFMFKNPKNKTVPGAHSMAGALRTPPRQIQDLQVVLINQSRETRNSSQSASTFLHWTFCPFFCLYLQLPSLEHEYQNTRLVNIVSYFFLCTFCLYISSALFLSFFNLNKLHFCIFIYISFFFPAMSNLL